MNFFAIYKKCQLFSVDERKKKQRKERERNREREKASLLPLFEFREREAEKEEKESYYFDTTRCIKYFDGKVIQVALYYVHVVVRSNLTAINGRFIDL